VSTTTQTSDPERVVPTRRISFEASLRGLPRRFAGDGDLIAGHIVAALSGVFPDGEDFFVRSVRHHRDRVTDPDLQRQVAGFIGQESVHGREHRALNRRLADLGYPTARVERLTRWGLGVRWRVAPARANLAATAALEHFTATLAELLMTDERLRHMVGHAEVRNLFLWHALEESEHKAVAFDVYKAVGGGERLRVWTMRALRYGFVAFMVVHVTLALLGDRDTYRARVLWRSLGRLRRSPVLSRDVWRRLCDYDRPDFHPDDRDTAALVAQWRTDLFGEHGTLNDRLAGSRAS
jgi:predicted metal-dependent hydrolase